MKRQRRFTPHSTDSNHEHPVVSSRLDRYLELNFVAAENSIDFHASQEAVGNLVELIDITPALNRKLD